MGNKGRSDPSMFGGFNHYDESGKKTGHSDPSLFGGYTSFDASGHKTGRSVPGLFGGYTHYDDKGHKIGRSDPGLFGGYNHYDAKGKRTGHSDPGLFGGYSHNEGGCYVATCVYGSYDCPEVWTLRRFRDDHLAATIFGRLFIRTYYALSPKIVKRFGHLEGFKRFWKKRLNHLVTYLHSRGVQDTPYTDRQW